MNTCLNNDIVFSKNKKGEKEFHGSSTDEVTLALFAQSLGVSLEAKSIDGVAEIVLEGYGVLYFKELQKIEFNSDRKRMTVCTQRVDTEGNPLDDKVLILSKGADSMIFERSNL